jgi:hypothetical protein
MQLARVFRWWWVVFLVSLTGLVVVPCMSDIDGGRLQIHKVFADLNAFNSALEMHREKFGRYPADEQGLELLVSTGALRRVTRDVWGNEYRYELRPFVYSIGADGVDSHGHGDDVVSWREDYHCEACEANQGFDWNEFLMWLFAALFLGSLLTGATRGA